MSVTLLTLAAALSVSSSSRDFSIPYEKYTLESNGLEVILSEDHRLPIVAVNIWYHAGPVNEPAKRTGFAHLFEHLMFQGSEHVGDDLHFKLLEASGASLINGTTDYDRTNYFETVPANDLELALWLESDRMGFLLGTLTQEKLDNQRDVVMNERRQSVDNAPYGPSGEKLVQALYPKDHPYYGYVIGSMDDLSAATLDDVKDFFTRYYAPANATLVIAGDFDKAKARELVSKYFGTLPRRPVPTARKTTKPVLRSEQRLTVNEPVALPQVAMAWHSPAAFAEGDATADVLAAILGQGKSSRLYKALVYEQQIAQQVSVHQESLQLGSVFQVTVQGKPGTDLAKLEAATAKVLDEIKTQPPTHLEVLRARNMLKTQMVLALQHLGGFGGKADMLNRYNHYVKNPGYLTQDLQRYEAISAEDVQELAKNMLDSNRRAVVLTVPTSRS